jgi:RNA recognition motif-containing protein
VLIWHLPAGYIGPGITICSIFPRICYTSGAFANLGKAAFCLLDVSPGSRTERGAFVKNIFVGNLSFNTTEDELRQLFETYGQVDRVSILTDRETGRSRGFGFVEMTNAEEGEKAIAGLNGSQFGGRTINVNEARPKAERAGSGGGGRERGRR